MAMDALPRVLCVLANGAGGKRPLPTVHERSSEAMEATYARLVERDAEPTARVAHAWRI